MTQFIWSKQCELGIDVIDRQHRRIIDYINLVYHAQKGSSGSESLAEVLNLLIDYTFSHLAFEEAMLEEIGYDDLQSHRLSHKSFEHIINDLRIRVSEGESVAEELAGFLQDWLINHIMVEDAKYVDAVNTTLLKTTPEQQRHWFLETVRHYFQ